MGSELISINNNTNTPLVQELTLVLYKKIKTKIKNILQEKYNLTKKLLIGNELFIKKVAEQLLEKKFYT